MRTFAAPVRHRALAALFVLTAIMGSAAAASAPALAQQVDTIDPNNAIDGDLAPPVAPAQTTTAPQGVESWDMTAKPGFEEDVASAPDASSAASAAASDPGAAATQGNTYKKDDLIGAAEGVFGKGAEGLARMIETWLDKQGEPNGYIVGREGGGAIVLGLRYGSGTLYHKVEGEHPVYWTGPSIGFDLGANAGNTFVLVYNLYDTEDIYKRFPAVEGQAYVVGGLHASYLRKGDIVLIPIRMGAGLRLGVNAGYMKIRKSQKWIPF